MPLYDYVCDHCGEFRVRRPMSESNAPTQCPICEADARRIVVAPFLATMNPNTRTAHARNEKSADAPQVMTRDQFRQTGTPRTHLHSHTHPHGEQPWARGGLGAGLIQSSRRWMIGH